MGLFSRFTKRPPDSAARTSSGSLAAAAQQARIRARRRLIGALVMFALGLASIPLVFETQPRPLPTGLRVELPGQEPGSVVSMPASVERSGRSSGGALRVDGSPRSEVPALVQPSAEGSGEGVAPSAKQASPAEHQASVAISASAAPQAVEHRPAVAKVPATKPAAPVVVAAPVQVKPQVVKPEPSKPVEPRPVVRAEEDRFVVQVGAFAEASGAREARSKVEALGMKTYTQEVEAATGRRIRVRVGPFATRAEAERAANRLKASGHQAQVLVL